ncbi:unnamed protein product [Pleuronectes platessa]|uniref:Uncharacterized protein n=1 Tax=Pleuronectes platessa TaxID=8262 RepID=A0A9N7Z0D2_PLEPL|nr:unnamed protein product [Pleuronectes platessa]
MWTQVLRSSGSPEPSTVSTKDEAKNSFGGAERGAGRRRRRRRSRRRRRRRRKQRRVKEEVFDSSSSFILDLRREMNTVTFDLFPVMALVT